MPLPDEAVDAIAERVRARTKLCAKAYYAG
jgi:hypothetical protein